MRQKVYSKFRRRPPATRRHDLLAVAYREGFTGVPSRYVERSEPWQAWCAGRDNRKMGIRVPLPRSQCGGAFATVSALRALHKDGAPTRIVQGGLPDSGRSRH